MTDELPKCVYCNKHVYPAEEHQHRKLHVPQLLADVRFTFHVDCHQARLRWKQEDEL